MRVIDDTMGYHISSVSRAVRHPLPVLGAQTIKEIDS
jgi:hypothetical protein